MNEDEFGDDGLEELPDTTLLDLEHQAASTQQARVHSNTASQRQHIHTYGAAGLSRDYDARKAAWRPPQPRPQPRPPASAPDPPSSDYGFDDEDVVDLDEPSTVTQPSNSLPDRRRAGPASRHTSKPPLDPETEAAFAAADAELGAPHVAQWTYENHIRREPNDAFHVTSLQARVAELEAEQARLKRAEEDARNAALAKQGEIAIVRANQEKATKEYERRLAVMQKLHADESARQRADLEAGRKEREKMETDNRFLQHDLAQESGRAKVPVGRGRAAPPRKEKQTPQKSRQAALGDGFDDNEVQLVSPSRSKEKEKEKERSQEQTPKVGAKRKRPAADSPIPALSFSQPPVSASNQHHEQATITPYVSRQDNDERYEFMQRLLRHWPFEGHERTIEALMKHAFPSSKESSLSSIFLDRLSYSNTNDEDNLALKVALVSLKLWSQCLEEKYYTPVYLLIDLIRSALRLEPAKFVVELVPQALYTCVQTIDLVANPTALASRYPSFTAREDFRHAKEDVKPHIDADEVLDVLLDLHSAASLDQDKHEQFWRSMDFTFMLTMLHKAQPLSQTMTTLHLLSDSATETNFGPISPDNTKQAAQETATIDRLTFLLFESFEPPVDEEPYSPVEILFVRLKVLSVLKSLCFTDHGRRSLCAHRSAIGRLVRFLHAQVSDLYTLSPPCDPVYAEQHPHTLTTRLINTTTRLLHSLHTLPETNILQKLSAVRGGYHKFLVSMTRIAFSDGLALEQGFEPEVVEAAHEILDAVLSPEEGEMVMRAMETPAGTGGATVDEVG